MSLAPHSPIAHQSTDLPLSPPPVHEVAPEIAALLAGVSKWRSLLLADADSSKKEELLDAYQAMGYVPSGMASSSAAISGDSRVILLLRLARTIHK